MFRAIKINLFIILLQSVVLLSKRFTHIASDVGTFVDKAEAVYKPTVRI